MAWVWDGTLCACTCCPELPPDGELLAGAMVVMPPGSVDTVCVCVVLPPVEPALPPDGVPLTERAGRSGVPCVPSASCQPRGKAAVEPLHSAMAPGGKYVAFCAFT